MQVFEAIDKRRSIRVYKDETVEKDKIAKLISAAILAPSAANKQRFKLIFVDNKETKDKLSIACNNQTFVKTASHVIAGVTEVWKWDQVDVAISLEHIALEAIELGLGTCWIGAFKEDEVKKILNIPDDIKVVALLTLGYPAESPDKRSRKELKEIIRNNNYDSNN